MPCSHAAAKGAGTGKKSLFRRKLVIAGAAVLLITALALNAARLRHGPRLYGVVVALKQESAAPMIPADPDPPGIVLHSSDSPAFVHGVPINEARLEEIHAHDHPSWAVTYEGKTYHIGYHYVILPDGTIEKGRPDHCIGAHARLHNNWLGICVVGAFSTKSNSNWWPSTPTDAQLTSIVSLCEELMSKYHIPPENVKRHRDVNSTWCPGGRFPFEEIKQQLAQYAADHPETAPHNNMALIASPLSLMKRP